MPITLTAGDGTPIPLGTLKDLANSASTELSLGMEFAAYLARDIQDVPDNLLTTKVQYTSGNQKWNVGAVAPVSFTLSGGVNGTVSIIKSGNVFTYTDTFPTKVTQTLDTEDDSKNTTNVPVPDGGVYLCIELDFSIQAGVSVTYQQGIFGLTGNASTSDTFQVAFYKLCKLADNLQQSLAIAFRDFVLPFHPNTLNNLKFGDYLRHTANANLQLGMGANIGYTMFSYAGQWKSGIAGVANSPTLTVGVKPNVAAAVKLAYSFGYVGTFDQLLWVDSASAAHLHLYRSQSQTTSLELSAGITAQLNASASTAAVQDQVTKSPTNATPPSQLQNDLSDLFNRSASEVSKASTDINSKLTALLKPLNNTAQITLDAKISQSNQNYLLLDYTIDLTNPAYATAWNAMVNGRFQDAIEQSSGSVQLDPGSGLEKLYSKTTSLNLNFFGQWVGNWSTAQISSSSLIYAGNNTFHLITVEGMQRLSQINKASTEIDVYFAAELDLTGEKPVPGDAVLNFILRANNNGRFGAYIAELVGLLTSGQGFSTAKSQIMQLANSPNTTEVLHIVFKPTAYGNLTFTPQPLAAGSDTSADAANYAAFAQSCATIMPNSPANFSSGVRQLSYQVWCNWNLAATDAWPPTDGALPTRKHPGDPGGSGAQSFITSQFGLSAPVPLFNYALGAASGFMNLCESLNVLTTAPDATALGNWNDLVANLMNIINRDMNLDFVAPTALALAKCCSNSIPADASGPVQGLEGDVSIAYTMTFA